ncbi:MAG: hypothetical protein ACYDAG_06470, partial [Chloroflexota bacterium]
MAADRPGAEAPATRHAGLARVARDIESFTRAWTDRPLRPHQLEPARAIVDAVTHRRGRSFTIMMARQMGKNELSAQLEAYLLYIYRRRGGTIVKAAPTFKPQLLNSKMRLERVLAGLPVPLDRQSHYGYIISEAQAAIHFLS